MNVKRPGFILSFNPFGRGKTMPMKRRPKGRKYEWKVGFYAIDKTEN